MRVIGRCNAGSIKAPRKRYPVEPSRFEKWLIEHPQQGLSVFILCLTMWGVLFWHMFVGT